MARGFLAVFLGFMFLLPRYGCGAKAEVKIRLRGGDPQLGSLCFETPVVRDVPEGEALRNESS